MINEKAKNSLNKLIRFFLKKIPLPPINLRFMNEDDERFKSTGDEIIEDLRKFANLNTTSSVIDIGSGYGRTAHALLRWGEYQGQYLGIDILSRHIKWCQDELSPCATNGSVIEFRHMDVKNDRYNPAGKLSTVDVDFRLKSGDADVVLLTSVFTHMYEAEIREYLCKIKLSLAPEGRIFATVFILNNSWFECHEADRSAYPMPHILNDHCRYMDDKNPLHAIAYSPEWLFEVIEEVGFKLDLDPILGQWCGRKDGYRWQDILVLSHA